MSEQMINGRKPASTKKKVSTAPENPYGGFMAVPTALKKEIEDQGLEMRFIDAPKLATMSGFHPKGWVPYKRKATGEMDYKIGSNPDGYVYRGTMVLAVRPKDEGDKHRAYLAHLAKLAAPAKLEKAHANKLRQMGAESGTENFDVSEGYDNN